MTRVLLIAFLLSIPISAEARPNPPGTSTAAAAQLPDVCPRDDVACMEAKRQQLEDVAAWEPTMVKTDQGQDLPSLGYMFFKMLLVLGAVCLLAYLSLGKLLPKLLRIQPPTANRKILQVVDRLPIDQRRSIMIVRTGEEAYFLVGVTDQGINLLSRLDSDELDPALAVEDQEPPKLGKLAQSLLGRKEG